MNRPPFVHEGMKNLHENPHSRSMEIGKYVTVSQTTDFEREVKWEEAEIRWSSIGSVDTQKAGEFANCVLEAIEVANEWNQERAGKPLKDVPGRRDK